MIVMQLQQLLLALALVILLPLHQECGRNSCSLICASAELVHRTASGEAISAADVSHLTSVKALHRDYGKIFKHGNRNAASHLWSTYLIDRAPFMPRAAFLKLAAGYCAVSGSPVTPADYTRYRMRLPRVDGTGKV